jgi:GDP-4-dehydro-6-deoxy-D-mannose reductase
MPETEVQGGQPLALITGASGFVGRHLIRELLAQTDWRIVGTSRRAAFTVAEVPILACDLRNRSLVERFVQRYPPTFVFHLAAESYVPKSIAAPADTVVNNIEAQINLFESILAIGLRPVVVLAGSSEQYGFADERELPIDENQPFRPGNPYAVSKIAQDMLGYQYFRSHGLPVVRMRAFNHIGPGQSDRFALSSFARQIAEAEAGVIEPTILTGDLVAERDFLDVRDVVRAYRLAALHGQPGEAYNLASGRPESIGRLLDLLVAMSDVPVSVRQDPARLRPSDVPRIFGSAAKFTAISGWKPEIPLEHSLGDLLEYWRGEVSGIDREIQEQPA